MAGQLLLVNPRKRRKSRKTRKSSSRRRNPVRGRRAKRHVARRSNPIRIHRKRARGRARTRARRRNPISLRGMSGGVLGHLVGALQGAGGAIVNDAAFTYIPLPAMLKSGPMSLVTRALGAFGVGYLVSMVGGKNLGAKMTQGALTVLAYQVAKPMVSSIMPLAGDDIEGLGYYSPGMILQDTLNPLPDLNTGTPLAAYLEGMGGGFSAGGGGSRREADLYDSTIDAYIE